ncbi:MAG: hypothetical protein KGO02_17570 [Alphaproteobacteria bacterium]|nr:hypothetical protein [Alphaproteobacteria bacterium]
MQDEPEPKAILAAIARLLRNTAQEDLPERTRFLLRVAANAADLVGRQLALEPDSDAAELRRLNALLGSDGTLAEQNARLCEAIEAGAISLASEGLVAHLRATALEKLAVDQPKYSAFVAAVGRNEEQTPQR